MWKLVISELKNDVSKEIQVQRIIYQVEVPPLLERQSIKVAINNVRVAKKSLEQTQINATNHRETFLKHKADEEEIKGNTEHARCLRMLIFIETQMEMHSTIRKFKTKMDKVI